MFRGQSLRQASRTLVITTTRRPSQCQTAFQHTLFYDPSRYVSHATPSLPSDGAELKRLNSITLGTEMPEITLANGEKVQTGTVGALLRNIVVYDGLIQRSKSAPTQAEAKHLEAEVAKYELVLKTPLPLLQKVGLFNLFSPEEWVDGGSPGRRFVGRCAIAAGY